MKKYLLTYVTPSGGYEGENLPQPSPEQRKAGTQAWIDWAKNTGKNLVEFGSPVKPAITINSAGETTTASPITGYTIVEAEDVEEVKRLLLSHPHLKMRDTWTINIHEIMPAPNLGDS